MSKIKLGIGVPAYRSQVHVGHARMWITFGAAIIDDDRFTKPCFFDMDCCGVDKARNFLIAYAMREGCDWLLMVDSDTWTPQGAKLLQMIKDASTVDAAIVGAPVYRRVDDETMLNVYSLDRTKLVPAQISETKTQLFKVDAIGAAVMAINLHKLSDQTSFRFTDELSEDLDFCKQVGQLGGTIWCDPRIRTLHAKAGVMEYVPAS